ncbi:MAG: tRNA (adenosine(37)-N6)-dimethylallyltransferase MiaA [bacterium]
MSDADPSTGYLTCGGICPVIVGPTAVGKTALIVSLASRYPVEVISLDSRQIYHGMRIGTAQPSAAEQGACRHHLVDFLSPREHYSAASFRRDFRRVYQDIRARGKVALLVGGAGLYLQAVKEGLFEMDVEQRQAAAQARAELSPLSDEEIRERLAAVDPASWQRIHANDRYRSQRALELQLATGRSPTELRREQQPRPVGDLQFPVVCLQRSPAELDARIRARTRQMLAAGWLSETRRLLAQHGVDAPGLQSIGYREAVAHLNGELSVEELEQRIFTVTRQYAKRQRTWFRPLPAELRGAPESAEVATLLEQLLARAAEKKPPGPGAAIP